MHGAFRNVDEVALAQRVETVLSAGMFAPRQRQRIDDPVHGDRVVAKALQLGVDEANVERRVMDHQRRIADELDEVRRDLAELRLVAQHIHRDAMHGLGVGMDVAILGMDVLVEGIVRRDPIEELDAPDLDDPIALAMVQARRLSVEHDLAQHPQSPASSGPVLGKCRP